MTEQVVGDNEFLRAGVVIILIGALALGYSIVMYAGAVECGPGATMLPCSLPFWKATAIMSLVIGAFVMAASIIVPPAQFARARAWLAQRRSRQDDADS